MGNYAFNKFKIIVFSFYILFINLTINNSYFQEKYFIFLLIILTFVNIIV